MVSFLHVGVGPFTRGRHSPLFSYSPAARVVTKTRCLGTLRRSPPGAHLTRRPDGTPRTTDKKGYVRISAQSEVVIRTAARGRGVGRWVLAPGWYCDAQRVGKTPAHPYAYPSSAYALYSHPPPRALYTAMRVRAVRVSLSARRSWALRRVRSASSTVRKSATPN